MSTPAAPLSGRTRLTARGRILVAVGAVLSVVGVVLAWRDVLRIGLLLLFLVAAVRWLYSRRGAQLRITREATPPRIPFGDTSRIRVAISNTGTRSTQLLLAEERLDYALGSRPRFTIPGLEPEQTRHITYSAAGNLRGRHSLGPMSLRQHDPFSITRRELTAGQAEEILVLPRVVRLPDINPTASGTGTAGDVPLMLALHGEDDVSIRAYHEGDDLRRVHWPASAHRGQIMMRQEERPSQRRAVLVLDSRADRHRGTGPQSSLEWAVTAIASTALRLHEQGFLTYLVTGETAERGLATTPMSGDEMLYWLALEEPTTDVVWRAQLDAAATLSHDQGLVVLAAPWRATKPDLPDVEIKGATAVGLAYVLDVSHFEEPASALPSIHGGMTGGWRAVRVRQRHTHADAWTMLVTASTGDRGLA